MSKTKQIFRQWLPLALVPMMSVAVLNGCSSDDDDNSGDDDTATVVIGDTDGNMIPDDFEVTTTGGVDLDPTDNIDDIYGVTDTGTDSNNNGVDDSFEASLTGGDDLDMNGIDDAAAAALVTDGDGDGTDGDGDGDGTDGDGDGDGTDGDGDGDGTDGDGDGTVNDTGSLGPLVLGSPDSPQGTVDLSWDGSVLSGSVSPIDSVGATEAWLYSGIAASNDPGASLLQLSGAAPNFTFPIGLSADQMGPIATAMASGNLFILVESASGQIRSDQLLPPGNAVKATYTPLTSSDTTVFSNGAAFMNVNTNTGDYTAYLNVNLNPEDTDSDGVAITVSAAHIHQDSIAGDVIVPLADTGAGIGFSATGQLTTDQLSIITNNNGWFNVHQNDGTSPGASFMSGQIQVP